MYNVQHMILFDIPLIYNMNFSNNMITYAM